MRRLVRRTGDGGRGSTRDPTVTEESYATICYSNNNYMRYALAVVVLSISLYFLITVRSALPSSLSLLLTTLPQPSALSTMGGLDVGATAPDFTLPGAWGDVNLDSVLVRGRREAAHSSTCRSLTIPHQAEHKYAVIFFYPGDFTPGCSMQVRRDP